MPNILGLVGLVVVAAFAVGYAFYLRHIILEARRDADDVYCLCADCIRCGCGQWERHHSFRGDVITKR